MSLLSFLTKTELPKEHDALVGREEKIFEPSSHFVNKNIYPINSSIFEKVYFGMGCCLLYTSPSPRDRYISRMPSSA